jgi:hypothetical protein
MKRFIGVLLSLFSLMPFESCFAENNDPVVFSFATVGDSRAEASAELNRQDRIWLQNTKAWSRIMREVTVQRPNAFFFNGDMIFGYTNDVHEMNRQYAYWRGMVTRLQEDGVYVVPVPGNHEVQLISKDAAGKVKKVANQSNENAWRENMGDLILDVARWKATTGTDIESFNLENMPQIGGDDNISTNQQQLSYSFDVGFMHFAVLNTDPVGNDGHAPVDWLKADFDAATARGKKRFFVFGHKPAFTYAFKPGVGLDGLDLFPENLNAFWSVIESSKATYFCGHEHIFNMNQPAKNRGGVAWQVLVGSGGSPFRVKPHESDNPVDRTYAWALVKVHTSGIVDIEAYGFDENFGSTKLLQKFSI